MSRTSAGRSMGPGMCHAGTSQPEGARHVLSGIGALALIGPGTQRILDHWPVVLVVIGVVILGRAYLSGDRS